MIFRLCQTLVVMAILLTVIATGKLSAELLVDDTVFFTTSDLKLFKKYGQEQITQVNLPYDVANISGLAVWRSRQRVVLFLDTAGAGGGITNSIVSVRFDGSEPWVHASPGFAGGSRKSLVVDEGRSKAYFMSIGQPHVFQIDLSLEAESLALPLRQNVGDIRDLFIDPGNDNLYLNVFSGVGSNYSRFPLTEPEALLEAVHNIVGNAVTTTFSPGYDALPSELIFGREGNSNLIAYDLESGPGVNERNLTAESYGVLVDSVVEQEEGTLYFVYNGGRNIDGHKIVNTPSSTHGIVTDADLFNLAAADITHIAVYLAGDGGDSGGGGGGDDGGGSEEGCDPGDPDGDLVSECSGDVCKNNSHYTAGAPCPETDWSVEMRCSVDPKIGGNDKYPAQNCLTVLDECPDHDERIIKGLCGDCEKTLISDESELEPGETLEEACNIDECPDDPNKRRAGVCGCGYTEDFNSEGKCIDGCFDDPDKLEQGLCGCRVSDRDSDNDTTPDCHDKCVSDPNKIEPGVCGCGQVLFTKKDGTEVCIEETVISKPPKRGDGIIRNPVTGDPLVPERISYFIPAECAQRCKITFEFGEYKLGRKADTLVLAGKKSKKRKNKSKQSIEYEFTLHELSSKGVKTKRRKKKRSKIAIGNLKPGTNYIGDYKINILNKKGRPQASSASSASINFRTPG